ncbi:serine/threonine-protein kinase S6KL [Ischnura elegans]|uniref:serine/threonine-protein kinase S6KL n=1 Tax=Ischnura elegans TaxID=197161 RepID=UPI001ED8B048|nr:serine/threonine-protein kinase S6KL [Ischnura elegans]
MFTFVMSARSKSSVGSCIPELLGLNSFRRRSQNHSTTDDFSSSKTAWPVSLIESIFFPEFKKKCHVTAPEFKVVETISKGAFGKVYKVEDDLGKEYAMKILSKAQIITDNAIKQVKDEVMIQSMCGHHPFIVDCPFFWQSKKQLFIVSTFVPGGELLHLWNKYGPFPEDVIRVLVAEIALGLDFLHNAGVIYRDLKLENILLDSDGHVQIIDFGLAKWLKHGARTSTICGTLQYMAPEILRMQPYTHSVDWWSLGVIFFALLHGSLPFDDSEVSMSPEYEPIEVPQIGAHCSPAAKDLLSRLLTTDPEKRLHSLLRLQGVSFYHKFSFKSVQEKKVSPLELLKSSAVPRVLITNQATFSMLSDVGVKPKSM